MGLALQEQADAAAWAALHASTSSWHTGEEEDRGDGELRAGGASRSIVARVVIATASIWFARRVVASVQRLGPIWAAQANRRETDGGGSIDVAETQKAVTRTLVSPASKLSRPQEREAEDSAGVVEDTLKIKTEPGVRNDAPAVKQEPRRGQSSRVDATYGAGAEMHGSRAMSMPASASASASVPVDAAVVIGDAAVVAVHNAGEYLKVNGHETAVGPAQAQLQTPSADGQAGTETCGSRIDDARLLDGGEWNSEFSARIQISPRKKRDGLDDSSTPVP